MQGGAGMRKCLECGTEIPWNYRSDKKYCGDNCRKRASRRSENLEKVASTVKLEIHAIAQLLSDERYRKQAMQLLEEITAEAQAATRDTSNGHSYQDRLNRDRHVSHSTVQLNVAQAVSHIQAGGAE